MLRTDLTDLINCGDMWAFVGSGASVDAGGPNWGALVQAAISHIDDADSRELVLKDTRYQSAYSNRLFAKCFSRIQAVAGREAMERAVATQLESLRSPGRVIQHISEWPFAGYITTNYDQLLKLALRKIGEMGWVTVGNSVDEVRKVAGDATRVIWHVHGTTGLAADSSRMILTEEDYDDLYLEGSPVVNQLRGLLTQRRLVFVGFGFEDWEVMRLLKLVGRLCNPARPAFAFLSGFSGSGGESQRIELLEKYNVDVIPYEVVNGSHEQLVQLLDAYNAFILRRSLRFGQSIRPCPSYDPETTGLLTYNQLALRQQAKVAEDVLGSLLKSRILSLLNYRGPCSITALTDDVAEKVRLIRGEGNWDSPNMASAEAVGKCLEDLARDNFVEMSSSPGTDLIASLTELGSSHMTSQAAAAERLSEQFSASLCDRAQESFSNDLNATNRVAKAAESFLKDCVQRRALGVAMSWDSPRMDFRRYHIVGLLQALPDFMVQLASAEEGLALVRLVQDVLAKPTEAESKYLGISLQAQFGVNLLGYDPDTVRTRAQELSRTLFLIDSSTLIPMLGRSSVGYQSARLLLERLSAAGAAVATTELLAVEVAEHARWAIEHIGLNKAPLTHRTFAVATGRAGSRSNVFLEGFLEEVSRGRLSLDFGAYLDYVCGNPRGHTATDEIFLAAIRKSGVPCWSLNQWEGFVPELWAERDVLLERIAERRKANNTYRHERQVKAEAEALLIIQNLRRGVFKVNGQVVPDAYFVSHTRAIDDVAGSDLPITMRPQAILHWLSTVTACAAEELASLVNGLLWELSERGLAIVDCRRLQVVFSPLLVAAREKLKEETDTHRVLIARQYGEDAAKAFDEINDRDLPVVVNNYYVQKAEELERQLERERKVREKTQLQVGLTEREREELAVLKAKEKQRKRKAQSRKRAAKSRKGRKK